MINNMGKKKDIMEFVGAWKNIPDNEIEEMKENIKIMREKSTQELSKRIKRLHNIP